MEIMSAYGAVLFASDMGKASEALHYGGAVAAACVAFFSGMAVACSTAAFILALGIVPRVAAISGTTRLILWYEDCVMAGIFIGILFELDFISLPLGTLILWAVGLLGGLFLGCWTAALGEIVNIYAVLQRRAKIEKGFALVVLSLALGKAAGALVCFLM